MASWEIVNRARWGADPPISKKSLKHPVTYIRTFALPNYGPCITTDECSSVVKKIQLDDIYEGKQTDIRPNFLIGDDGKVYEGRGWFSQPPPHSVQQFTGQFLDIAHIGGKGDVPPTLEFTEAKQKLIEFGTKKKFINEFHSVI